MPCGSAGTGAKLGIDTPECQWGFARLRLRRGVITSSSGAVIIVVVVTLRPRDKGERSHYWSGYRHDGPATKSK